MLNLPSRVHAMVPVNQYLVKVGMLLYHSAGSDIFRPEKCRRQHNLTFGKNYLPYLRRASAGLAVCCWIKEVAGFNAVIPGKRLRHVELLHRQQTADYSAYFDRR